jgi:hypothetical protein
MEGQASLMLQLLFSVLFLLFFICLSFLPCGKGLMKSHFFFTICCLNLHLLHTKMKIICDGMGPFTPTRRSHSLSIALKYACVDHLRVMC